jgi:integrase
MQRHLLDETMSVLPMNADEMDEAWRQTVERAQGTPRLAYGELPAIRCHDLRHTWATLAFAAAVDVPIVSRRRGTGHTRPPGTRISTW